MKKTTLGFKKLKQQNERCVMVTAYDAPGARAAEAAGVDLILVGDSLGMTVLGYDTTTHVTTSDMIHHTRAVKRGAGNTFIVTDMPFLTAQGSDDRTLDAALRLMQEGGADAVKIEGAGTVFSKIRMLTEGGIPVCAHLGLTPQTVGVDGGYRVRGRTQAEKDKLMKEAFEAEQAGAFMLVLECVTEETAEEAARQLDIPVIGIGAGRCTDGQVLVYHDIIGQFNGKQAKFVKQYADAGQMIETALCSYAKEVRSGAFPETSHTFEPMENPESLYGGSK
ncbi:3-methyl-2-oxobutanoate hydroxymethyltransferase [Alkalicoccus luteus]|uniref:3-methyl-2-oxobutanoate hydroxymethyltransferase n=1 Tax=Alkalicoccus luteus TaxID=1237094 RepID=UPI004034F517